jgi:hypothetical protein
MRAWGQARALGLRMLSRCLPTPSQHTVRNQQHSPPRAQHRTVPVTLALPPAPLHVGPQLAQLVYQLARLQIRQTRMSQSLGRSWPLQSH